MTKASRPAASSRGPRAAADHLLLAPEEIVLEGPYVRQYIDPAELEALRQAVQAGGEIKQAIGVRVEGEEGDPRYVLVYGMRRWLASKEAGLARIPVRDHGRITVAESIALQVTENEARVDPHPVDTAVSYQLLVQEGEMSQAAVARLSGRSAAHVSYMRAVGEAILELEDEERTALYASPDATVPRFQKIAPLKTVRERVAALRALIGRGRAPRRPATAPSKAVFRAGPSRVKDGWQVRLSYRDDEIRTDPELAARMERFLEEQLDRLRGRMAESYGRGGSPRRPVTFEIEPP